MLGWPNYADNQLLQTPAYSGGSWVAGLPLTNLKDRRLHRVARSTNALAASTQFDVDLGQNRTIGMIALPKSNISTAGTVRARLYTGAGHTSQVYDSTALNFWPAGLTVEDTVGLNIPWVVFPAPVAARYLFLEVTDTGNAAGYIELARLVLASVYQPVINPAYGVKMGMETDTERVVADGAAAYYNERPMRRNLQGVLMQIAETEAHVQFWRIMKQAGISKQVMVVYDPADANAIAHERRFLGVFKAPSALSQPNFVRYEGAFSFVEEL